MSDPTPTPAPTPSPATEPATPAGEQAVPYARFQEVNTKYNALKAQIATLSSEREQQTAAATTLEQRLAAIEGQYNTEKAARVRLEVASRKKLPTELADRLQGTTEDELAADADRLLAFLRPISGPGVPPTGGGGGSKIAIDTSKMTAAQIRAAHAEGKI